MSEELSGLELRKALLEALGWRLHKSAMPFYCWYGPDRCAPPAAGVATERFALICAPAFESNPSTFWPEFEKWCDENSFTVEILRQAGTNPHRIKVELSFKSTAETRYYFTEGNDLLTGLCRAWLQALQAKEER